MFHMISLTPCRYKRDYFPPSTSHYVIISRQLLIVPLSPKMVAQLESYLRNVHKDPNYRDNPLFYSIYKGKIGFMTERNLERIVKKYSQMVQEKLPDSVYPHMFRRTRATGLYRDGVELEMISRILGHESTETTKKYAIPSVEMMRQAMGIDDEKEVPQWTQDIDEVLKLCGFRA